MEEHAPPAGIQDVKGYPSPKPFTGRQTDAVPFLSRLKAFYTAKPNAMKFTRNRILVACEYMADSTISKSWANLVRKAIAEGINNNNYYDMGRV
jgi:hypothetical protein